MDVPATKESVIRFGIALPTDGPLAGTSAVTAAARAAAQLGYASLWAPTVAMLQVASGVEGCVPLALLLPDGSPDIRAAHRLGALLAYVAGPAAWLDVVRPQIATALLFDTGDRPPDCDAADGWTPLIGPATVFEPRRDPMSRPRRLIARMAHVPSDADLHRVLAAHAEELIVALPDAADLDQELAAFADVAERVAEAAQLTR